METTKFFLLVIIIDLSSADVNIHKFPPVDGNTFDFGKKIFHSEETGDNLILRIYPEQHYLSGCNRSSQIVSLLDYTKDISVLYDGNKGDLFAFLYEEHKAIYIPSNVSNKTWHSERQSYEEYFKNPIPPTELIRIGKKFGYQFNSLTISENFAKRIFEILSLLSIDFNDSCQSCATRFQLEKRNSDLFKTNLWGFEKVMKPKVTECRGDLNWVMGLNRGLAFFFEPFGGLRVLEQKEITLDFKLIHNSKNCFKLLNYFLNELHSKFDLGQILKKRFNSRLEFFILISGLSGDISYDFDGFIFMITEVFKVNYDKNSRKNLLEILRRYLFNLRAKNNNLKLKLYSEIRLFIYTCKLLKLDDDFHDLIVMLNQILEEKWIHNGVNMSIILKAIMEVKFPATEDDFNKIVKVLDVEFKAKWKHNH